MKIIEKYMTHNDCYTANKKILPKGIMVHSDGCKAGLKAADWFSRWNKSFKAKEIDREVCVHAFVDDRECYQYLPWNHRGWHGGGKSNDTHIGFEICEPKDYDDKAYFAAIWDNATELCVMLCKQFSLTEKDIICHCEGYKLGIASNHGDVMHWFPKHGKNMDMFRAEVKSKLNPSVPAGYVKMDYKGKALHLKADNKNGSYKATVGEMAKLNPDMLIVVRDTLEQNGFKVDWNGTTDTIVVR